MSDSAAPPAFQSAEEIAPKLRRVTFTLYGLTPTLNELRKMHFGEYKRTREAIAWSVRAALNGAGYFAQAPMRRARVEALRHSVGMPDHDGLVGGVKPLIDTLVMASLSHPNGLGVIVDDKPACLVLQAHSVRVATLKEQRVIVEIEELEALPEAPVKKRAVRRSARTAKPSAARVARWNAVQARVRVRG